MPVTEEIRPADREDLPFLLQLEQQAFCPPWTEAMLREELDSPDARVLIYADTEPVGFAVYHRAGDQAELYQIAVLPEKRRRGIAAALLAAGDRAAGDMACTSLFLEVRASNEAAVCLYEAGGYHQIGKRKKYYVNPVEDALLYCKELKP